MFGKTGKRNHPDDKNERIHTPAASLLQVAAGLARGADRILTALVALVLAVVFMYACYALWDTWQIYEGAGIDESLLKYKPELDKDNGDTFEKLMEINPDVCAWLTIEDTHIDYPVVQGEDNVTYLNTDVYGEFSLSGSIFLDYRNARDFSDSYSLIYGHHMDGDVMFGELGYFSEDSYFEKHQTGILYLPDRTYQFRIFACLQTDAYNGLIFSPGNLSEDGFGTFLGWVEENAIQYREIPVSGQNRILSLSTCSDTSTNARTIVLGYLDTLTIAKGDEG